MNLRRRLITIQVIFVALGLGVFAVVTYQLYSHSRYQGLDTQLANASPGIVGAIAATHNGDGSSPHGPDDNLPPGSYGELRSATGAAIPSDTYHTKCYTGACPTPKLPAVISAPAHGTRYMTVAATTGSTTFRVQVSGQLGQFGLGPGAGGGGGVPAGVDSPIDAFRQSLAPGDFLVTAVPLNDVNRSLHELVTLELVVGVLVLAALSLGGLVVIGKGLQPLTRLTGTARAIAKGDLGLRASPADGRGEVGQLGLAFNTMMTSIEKAFAAQEASEGRLRQFLADASHELRTPLTSIRGYAELYRMGVRGADLDTAIERIEQHAVEMGALVEELLLLARLDQTAPPRRDPVDLTVIAAECVGDAAVIAHGRHLTLDAPEPVTVVGDALHLRRAVTNLVANAIRHTPAGTPIEVSVAASGGAAVLEVRDHGPGMDAEGLQHAFDRFWRADRSRTGTGAGLGLAIVAGVATEHGGHATVANAPDGGAVFTIRLPVPVGSEPVLR